MTRAAASKGHARRRHGARMRALQALYQWLLTADEAADIETQFLQEQDMSEVDVEYFSELFRGVARESAQLEHELSPYLDRPADRVDPVERSILLLAAFELKYRLEVPYRVVLDEAIELAKSFGAEAGHRFVNAVLDRAATHYRAVEIESGR